MLPANTNGARIDALWDFHDTEVAAKGFSLKLRDIGTRQGINYGSSLEEEEGSAGHHFEVGSNRSWNSLLML